jgi:hypothetical protein
MINFQSLKYHICRFQYLGYNMHIYTIYCIEKRSFFLNYSGYESWTIFERSPFDLSNINAKLQYIMFVSQKSAFLLTCRV